MPRHRTPTWHRAIRLFVMLTALLSGVTLCGILLSNLALALLTPSGQGFSVGSVQFVGAGSETIVPLLVFLVLSSAAWLAVRSHRRQ